MNRRLFIVLLGGFFCFISLILGSCNGARDQYVTPSPALPTVTPIPTSTSTPVPGRVVLVAPLELDPIWVSEVQNALGELAATSGMVLDIREVLSPEDIGEDWKVVVFLSTPANLNDVLSSAPQVQFLVINAIGLQPNNHLSLLRGRPDWLNFIAGYVTILVAPDWRSMGLLPADEPYGSLISEAFQNGAHYFCGRCAPVYSPVVLFPLYTAMPSGTDARTWQSLSDQMLVNIIYAAYVAPEAASLDLLNYLASSGLVLVGGTTPPDTVRTRWAATVKQDFLTPLNTIWGDLMSGQGGKVIDASIQLTDINNSILTTARIQLVEQTVQDLQNGWIVPLTYSQPIQ